MTAITLHLSDNLVYQAKQAGIYNEKVLSETLTQFLTEKLNKSHKSTSSVYDFVMTLPKADYADDGLTIQQKMRDEW